MGRSRVTQVLAALPLLPLILAFTAPAQAQMLGFDFDDDDDPATIVNQIEADVGSFVTAHLVVSALPTKQFDWLQGVLFGLELTEGIELLTMSAPRVGALVLQDGLNGIAIAYGAPINVEELPVVAARFVLRVTAAGAQTVSVGPSTGWGEEQMGFVATVATTQFGIPHQIHSQLAIVEQRRGLVNSDQTPNVVDSWSAIKDRFAK